MQVALLTFVFLAAPAMAAYAETDSVSMESVQEFEKDAKNRPVSKVINLLKDMVKQLEKEGEEDEEIYETMGCWCVTNDKAKTKSIANAETEIETLTATIESLTATSAKLNTEIKNLGEEIAKNEEALATATSVREKELAEFTQEEKESLVTINQLKAAVVALSAAHDAALLKKKSKVGTIDANKLEAAEKHRPLDPDFVRSIEQQALRAHMHRIIATHPMEFINAFLQANHHSLSASQRHEIFSFLQGPSSNSLARKIREYAMRIKDEKEDNDPFTHANSFKGLKLPAPIQSLLTKVLKHIDTSKDTSSIDTGFLESAMDDSETGKTHYEPASGAIFGILKQMKENFEINLEQSQQAEAKAVDEFDKLKAAKEDEIKTSTDLVNTKTDELAATDEKNAESKEIKEDTEASLAADQAFLADLKERCASMDKEFEERTKGRQLEIEAVSKALAFLNSDEAHDLFTRTFNPSFLQVDKKQAMGRKAAEKILKNAALRTKDLRMLRLAGEVKKAGDNAAFDKVKKEVFEMIDKLKKEQSDEVKRRDWCIESFNTNERAVGNKERDRDDLIALIDDLKMTIQTLEKEIEILKAEIADLQVQLKRAGENREKENAEFQTTVADQRATQKLLAVSLKILTDFYKHQAFVQESKTQQKVVAGQAPPPGFRTYEKSASSGGVMGMMQSIIDDAKAMEAECIRAEEKAQKDYDMFVKDTTKSIEMKSNDIDTKTEDKAKAEADKVQAQKDLDATLTELETLTNEEHDLHKQCDFLLKNFEASQAARSAEIESLKQANQIFSGASFQLFLQKIDAQ